MSPRRLLPAALAWACLALTATGARAFTGNAGGSTAQFLRVGAGARALGMGDAYGPIAEGPEAIYWNPAGLAAVGRLNLAYTHIEMLRHFHHDYVGLAHPVPWLGGAAGLAMTTLYQDKIERVTRVNKRAGEFGVHSEAISLAYARSFGIGEDMRGRDRGYFEDYYHLRGSDLPLYHEDEVWVGSLMAGLAFKLVNETIDEHDATSFAADGGVLFNHSIIQELKLSFTFKNLGTRPRFISEQQSLPAEIAVGAAYDSRWDEGYQRFITTLEVALPYFGAPVGKAGLEYNFPIRGETSAAARMGFNTLSAHDLHPLSGLTCGFGVRLSRLSVDFGFQPMIELGEIYRTSLGYRF